MEYPGGISRHIHKQSGCTPLAEHKIDVIAKQAIRVKPYPMPHAKQKEVDEEVQKMLEAGIIDPSRSWHY